MRLMNPRATVVGFIAVGTAATLGRPWMAHVRRKLADVFHPWASALGRATSDSRRPSDPPTQSLATVPSGRNARDR
jgi:hypothetical protein